MITIRGLRKHYGSLEVLQGIDAQIPAGKVTAIVGPNAAGKTTLIKSILGLTRKDAGSIEVDSMKVNGDETYRRKIGPPNCLVRIVPNGLTHDEFVPIQPEPDARDLPVRHCRAAAAARARNRVAIGAGFVPAGNRHALAALVLTRTRARACASRTRAIGGRRTGR